MPDVFITREEWYPVFIIRLVEDEPNHRSPRFDIPAELIERWWRLMDEYESIQETLTDIAEKPLDEYYDKVYKDLR